MFGYKYLKAITKEGTEIFIIASPDADAEFSINKNISVYMLADHIYYLPKTGGDEK
jgi:cellobiose-specific phosphotransferase system component IIB